MEVAIEFLSFLRKSKNESRKQLIQLSRSYNEDVFMEYIKSVRERYTQRPIC
jgi:hypothetical protein